MPLDSSDHQLIKTALRELGSALDSVSGALSNDVSNVLLRLPNQTERRRYALLQAASFIAVMLVDEDNPKVHISQAVDFASDLLAEIEKREGES